MGLKDFLVDIEYKHGPKVDKKYQKLCEMKIKDLCGGKTPNESFKTRVRKFKVSDNQSNTYEKFILKFECKYGTLKFEDIEDRLDELLQLDAVTLSEIMADEDSYKFKTQKDIEDYVGNGYVSKFKGELKDSPDMDTNKRAESLTKNERIEQERIRRENQRLANEKRKTDYGRNKKSIQLEEQRRKEEFRKGVNQKRKIKEQKRQNEQSCKKDSVPEEKLKLIKKGKANIEVFKKVKSNTALASTALFLATGVFVAEAKEEMKWVKTELLIQNDGIKIKNPPLFHKYSDFRYFKVKPEDGYYLFFIGFDDENLVHFRTKESYLHEVIIDKFDTNGLSYESI